MRPATQEQLVRRMLAFGGLLLLLAGLLAAFSSFVVVAVVAVGLLLAAVAAGGVVLIRSLPIRQRLSTILESATRQARRLGRLTRDAAIVGTRHAKVELMRARRSFAAALRRVPEVLSARGRRREADRHNELGTRLRREGNAEQAAEQHRAALAIARELGDEQAEALTLNGLALALAQGGAEEAAVEHFDQARTVLRRLGDEEREGQVIANLGIVHHRQGREEEAVTLLRAALDKLPPSSPAHRRVEEQLRRAS
jgi:tetratricopeptide (TPR) repeat protein